MHFHRLRDSLFPGGPGRTTNPTDFTSLMDDLESRVFDQLPDETWFYPGHGKDSTLGAEPTSPSRRVVRTGLETPAECPPIDRPCDRYPTVSTTTHCAST